MRRFVPIAIVALALLALASAAAAKPAARLVVSDGSARAVGGKLRGWFLVRNRGDARSRPTEASVRVGVGEPPSRVLRKWIPRRATIPPLRPSQTHRVVISAAIPEKFGATHRPITACVEGCRRIGRLMVMSRWERAHPNGRRSAGGSSGGGASGAPSISSPPSVPISTVPTDPIPYVAGEPFEVSDGAVDYWAFVPDSYDPSNQTATPLLVWLHGCEGESSGDIWVVDPGAEGGPQDWLTLALSGREGGGEGVCWKPSVDEAKVMAALADFETHFHVDRRRVILGGYSAGGDLTYRTGFRHSAAFAGLLIENSSPFRDTESTEAESLAAATTKLHIVHLAHLQDSIYKIGEVRQEVGAVAAAGFPIELIERPGQHYDASTEADLRTYLLPHIDDGWLAPSP